MKFWKKMGLYMLVMSMTASSISPALIQASETKAVVEDENKAVDSLERYAVYENVALHKPVTVSGTETSAMVGSYLTDGLRPVDPANTSDANYKKRWSSNTALNAAPVWAYIDFEEVRTIESLNIYWQKANASEYQIQISNTAQADSWKTVKSLSYEQVQGPRTDQITLDQAVEARYVRIYVTKNNGEHKNVGIYEVEVFEQVEESSENVNLALKKAAYSNGNEVEKFSPDLATDGKKPSDMTKHDSSDANYTSRWSSKTSLNDMPVWLYVDLGAKKTIAQVDVYWQKANASEYQIQISDDASQWTTVKTVTKEVQSTVPRLDKILLDNTEHARYVRIYVTKNNGEHHNVGIFEVEVYARPVTEEPDIEKPNDEELVLGLLNEGTVTIENGKLVLPEYEGYTFSLYGSNNQQVVDMTGAVITPLVDMKVNLILQAKKNDSESPAIVADKNIEITVPGQYSIEETDNAKPDVLPALREWKGMTGTFEVSDSTKIVYNDASLKDTVNIIQGYFDEMLNKELSVGTTVSQGDIALIFDPGRTELGEEGYVIEIGDTITITAPTAIGLLYGGISITQILYQDEGMDSIPKGFIRDYPMYEVRACMQDVGRMYFPIEYVQEMATYMTWYKLNELHLGTNNSRIQTGYTAFRLDTEQYPALASTDGHYEKEAYKEFQENVDPYGITIVTEIDTPAHSGRFVEIDNGSLMMDFNHLDITTPEKYDAAIAVVKNIMDEYLGESVEDPNRIIQEDVFHIGTDEYPTKYVTQFKNYTADLINHVTGKGYEVRLWGSLKNFDNPDNPIYADNATINQWSESWASAEASMAHGFNLINTLYNYLYIVPGLKGYPEFLPLQSRYNNWDVTNYGRETLLKGEPKNVGAEFCVWMDTSSYNGGWSWFDAFDRFKDGVMLISEKTWYGEQTEDQTAKNFMDRVEKLGEKTPYANPSRRVDSDGDKVLAYDFETVEGTQVLDTSANVYNALLSNQAVITTEDSDVLTLDGNSYLELPIESIGHPYTIVFDIRVDEDCPADAELLSSKDGTLYVNMNGNVGFKRQYADLTGYTFEFDYQLPKDIWTNLAVTCNGTNTYLIVNGEDTYTAINKHEHITVDSTKLRELDSTTFVAGLSKIGNKFKGSIDNLVVMNVYKTAASLSDAYQEDLFSRANLAYGKTAEANQIENNTSFYPAYVTDGLKPAKANVHDTADPNYMYRWSSSNTKTEGPAELVIDLENVSTFDKIDIYWQKANASVYEIQVSDTGEEGTWETIVSFQDANRVKNPILDSHSLEEAAVGRYLKIYVIADNAATNQGNVGIFEVEVYNTEKTEFLNQDALDLLEEAKWLLDTTNAELVQNDAYAYLEEAVANVECMVEQEDRLAIAKYWSTLAHRVETFKENVKEAEFAIVTQPVDTAAATGEDAAIFVEATGKDLTYEWYYKNPGNKKFYKSGDQFISEDGSSYTIPMYAWRDGQEVYCVITDANGDTLQTNTVTLTLDTGTIRIIEQPVDVAVNADGDEAVVSVKATGEGLTYEWYYKNPGNKKFYLSGEQFVSEDGASYSIPVKAWRDGEEVYCVITDVNGNSVQTNTVTLSIAK